jgi:H+-transporting ATPase
MTIAYDHTRIDPKPVKWQMGRVLSVSTVLGAMSVIQTFGLLFIGMHFINQKLFGVTIDPRHLQTMIFLQLVVGGHLMLFVTRTKHWFFMRPFPSVQLFWAIIGTQVFAAVMCGFGWNIVPQLPWALIGLVWVYNLRWMFIQDIVKKITYRLLDYKAVHQAAFLNKQTKSLTHDSQQVSAS